MDQTTDMRNLKSYQLKICLQKEHNTSLLEAFPLCIILSEDSFKPLFYENFVNVFGFVKQTEDTDIWMIDSFSFEKGYHGGIFNEVLNLKSMSHTELDTIKDIVFFIKENIDRENYLVLFLDEFYLKSIRPRMEMHNTHELLVYGYDLEKDIVMAVGFDKNYSFSKIDIPLTELVRLLRV